MFRYITSIVFEKIGIVVNTVVSSGCGVIESVVGRIYAKHLYDLDMHRVLTLDFFLLVSAKTFFRRTADPTFIH